MTAEVKTDRKRLISKKGTKPVCCFVGDLHKSEAVMEVAYIHQICVYSIIPSEEPGFLYV